MYLTIIAPALVPFGADTLSHTFPSSRGPCSVDCHVLLREGSCFFLFTWGCLFVCPRNCKTEKDAAVAVEEATAATGPPGADLVLPPWAAASAAAYAASLGLMSGGAVPAPGGGGKTGAISVDTMRPGDWVCPNPRCSNVNFGWRLYCHLCNTAKSADPSSSSRFHPY